MNAQQALECLHYLDGNEPFDFSDGDVSGSGSDRCHDGDLGDDSEDDENGAGDGKGPIVNIVDGESDDGDDPLVVGRGVRRRGRGRGHRGGRCRGRGRGSGAGGGGRGRGHGRGV